MKKFVGGLPITKSNLIDFLNKLNHKLNEFRSDKSHSPESLIHIPDIDLHNLQDTTLYSYISKQQENKKNACFPYSVYNTKQKQSFLIIAIHSKIYAYTIISHNNNTQLEKIANAEVNIDWDNFNCSLHMSELNVVKTYQNMGIGANMLSFIESYACFLKCSEVSLNSKRRVISTSSQIEFSKKHPNQSINILNNDKYFHDLNEYFYLSNGYKHTFFNQAKYNPTKKKINSDESSIKSLTRGITAMLNNQIVGMNKTELTHNIENTKKIHDLLYGNLDRTLYSKNVKYKTNINLDLYNISNLEKNYQNISLKTAIDKCKIEHISSI